MSRNCRGRGRGSIHQEASTSAPVAREESEEECLQPNSDETSRDLTLKDLASMLQSHIAAQDVREARRSQEAVEQERQMEALRDQFSRTQQDGGRRWSSEVPRGGDVRGSDHLEDEHEIDGAYLLRATYPGLHAPRQAPPRVLEPRLVKLTDSDDVEHYLITFERVAAACRWPRADWTLHLIPLLTGKARSAYVHMDGEDSLDYVKVSFSVN